MDYRYLRSYLVTLCNRDAHMHSKTSSILLIAGLPIVKLTVFTVRGHPSSDVFLEINLYRIAVAELLVTSYVVLFISVLSGIEMTISKCNNMTENIHLPLSLCANRGGRETRIKQLYRWNTSVLVSITIRTLTRGARVFASREPMHIYIFQSYTVR